MPNINSANTAEIVHPIQASTNPQTHKIYRMRELNSYPDRLNWGDSMGHFHEDSYGNTNDTIFYIKKNKS